MIIDVVLDHGSKSSVIEVSHDFYCCIFNYTLIKRTYAEGLIFFISFALMDLNINSMGLN